MSVPMVSVTIDGRTVQVPKGTNIIEAAKVAGIEIPVFCYHPKLDPVGVCRMCLVQIEKIPKPQAACVTPVDRDGMVITTNSQQVDDLRKGALEFLLLNHPLDCPVCDKGGECDLQDLTLEYGKAQSRLQDPKIHKPKAVDLGNFIVLDNERCILCRRCVRFDNEVATEGNLIIAERAHWNVVTTMEDMPYDSYFSGNTIELCPVGALTSEQYRFQGRPWDLSRVDSICHGCSVGCNVQEEYRFGKLLRLEARDNEAIDRGWMCDRGRFNYKWIHQPDRITKPMVKKDGQFVPVTWGEAMTTIAETFKGLKQTVGGKAFGVIGGGKLANEEGYLLQKFARVALGTNNVDHRVSDQLIASLAAFPGRQTDLSDAGAILIVDTDPVETAPVMDLRIRRQADRKLSKLALVGSVMPKYRGRHARIQVKPGQTPAVISALAAVAQGKTPGPSAADPVALTKLMEILQGVTKVAIVYSGADAATGRAVVELAASLKKAQVGAEPGRSVHVIIPGAQSNSRGAEAMGVLPNYLPGYGALTDARARENVSSVWNLRNLPAEPGLSTASMLKAAADGEVKALMLVGANIVNTWHDRKLATAALDKAFVVAFDLFMNETVQKADVVLPVAAIGEKAGSYTTLDGIVQTVKAAKRKEGSAQPDGDILVALAQAMSYRLADSPAATAAEIGKLVARLESGAILPGAPTQMLPTADAAATAAAPAAQGENDLVLVPVTRLYAGGSTALFDVEFNHAQPKAEVLVAPLDGVRMNLDTGDEVELTANGESLHLTVRIEKSVVVGTVQVVRNMPSAPVNLLTSGNNPNPAVTLAKLGQEVAD